MLAKFQSDDSILMPNLTGSRLYNKKDIILDI